MLLVFGARSTDYDFGPGHPLTPRRFGPGIDLQCVVMSAHSAFGNQRAFLAFTTGLFLACSAHLAAQPGSFP